MSQAITYKPIEASSTTMLGINNVRCIIAFIYTGVISASVVFIAPLLVGGMISSRGFSEQDAGLMVSLETASLSLAALLGTLWITRLNWRQVTLAAALLLLVGNLASLIADTLPVLMACRFISGFGAGTFVALTYGALSQSAHPDRNFGLFSMGQLLYAAASLWLLPYVVVEYNLNGIYAVLAVLATLALFMYRWMPHQHKPDIGATAHASTLRHLTPIILMLLAIFLFFAAQSSIWTYAERMGLFAGFEITDVGFALAIGAAAGFGGASCATWLNKRYGRFAPITILISVKLLALYFLLDNATFALFVTLICALKFSWNFIIPYQLGLLSEIDPSGKSAVISSFITGMGLSAGAALSALVVDSSGYDSVFFLSAACCLLSFLMMAIVIGQQNKKPTVESTVVSS